MEWNIDVESNEGRPNYIFGNDTGPRKLRNITEGEENNSTIIWWRGKQPREQRPTHVICSIYPKINSHRMYLKIAQLLTQHRAAIRAGAAPLTSSRRSSSRPRPCFTRKCDSNSSSVFHKSCNILRLQVPARRYRKHTVVWTSAVHWRRHLRYQINQYAISNYFKQGEVLLLVF